MSCTPLTMIICGATNPSKLQNCLGQMDNVKYK